MDERTAAPEFALTREQQSFYAQEGYYSPLRVFPKEEAVEFRGRFDNYIHQYSDRLGGMLQRDKRLYFGDTHLFLSWVHRIVSHPPILDAVASVIGPNVLVWGTQWFPKLPAAGAYVSWHQDGTYWGLHPPSVTTAWIALSESNPENGCMRVVPQTQKTPQLPQRETYAPDNMLSRGQEIAVKVDEGRAVDLILCPGEMSLHHIGIVHGSGPNNSDQARIGLAIRYIAPEVVQDGPDRDIAVLVRGCDAYGHFDLVDAPLQDTAPGESPIHAEALRRKVANTLRGASPPAETREG